LREEETHDIFISNIHCLLPRHANWQIGADGYAEEDISKVYLAMHLADSPAQKTTIEEFLK
jgi:hypothetical protein